MEPMIFGRLLALAAVRPSDAALVIGAGTGYSAAVLARVASRVVALESDAELAGAATQRLQDLAAANVAIIEGPLAEGAPRQAPFDVILFDGAIERAPLSILDQLADGGRLVAVIKTAGIGRATLMTRQSGIAASRAAFDAAVPCLPGFDAEAAFVF
jgi:protein-L-isoaspartate(D-aspartate) O-methyltransferase